MVPVMAIVALASYLWLAPGPGRPISAAEFVNSDESPDQDQFTIEPNAEEFKELSAAEGNVTTNSSKTVEKQLEGQWDGFYQGKRRMTVRSDGTCTMTAEPEGIAATLLAAKLTFEIRWKISGEHMEFETISGEPLSKVKIVLRMYGSQRSHKILKIAANELVLLDEDGVTRYEWHRMTDAAE
jgi:hypothetical protein